MRTYRASSLGSCTRAQIAVQLSMAELATSDRMEALYARGRDHEVECLAAMEADGWSLLDPNAHDGIYGASTDADQFYVELEVAGAKITGHLDGLGALFGDHDRVVEVKSPQSFHKWETAHKTGDYTDPLMNRYAWQISVYMAATGLEAVVACVEDGQVRTFGIEVAPYSLDDITGRVQFMENAVEHQRLSPVHMMACSQNDYPCPVAYLHDRPEVIDDPILDQLLANYAADKQIKDRADQSLRETRDAIDTHLGLSDTLTTAAGTVTRVPASMVTDWKASYLALVQATRMPPDAYQMKKPRAGYINVTPKATDATP